MLEIDFRDLKRILGLGKSDSVDISFFDDEEVNLIQDLGICLYYEFYNDGFFFFDNLLASMSELESAYAYAMSEGNDFGNDRKDVTNNLCKIQEYLTHFTKLKSIVNYAFLACGGYKIDTPKDKLDRVKEIEDFKLSQKERNESMRTTEVPEDFKIKLSTPKTNKQ